MRQLCHPAGQLLRFLLQRLSIPREAWAHACCYQGQKKELSGRKPERLRQLAAGFERVREVIRANEPCVVVGMGKLACEFLTGSSLLITKTGTCWRSKESSRKVWICHSTEAALFDPNLAVNITGVLAKAAEAAGIETKFDPAVPMFNRKRFQRYRSDS